MLTSLKLVRVTDSPSRFILVVSAKVARLAVTRNQLKRRARHILRRHGAAAPKGNDVFIFFKPGVADLAFGELEAQLVFLLKRAKII